MASTTPQPALIMTAAGALEFARYAYPPNALGYCGPDDGNLLLEYADAEEADGGLAEAASQFSGAWPYLELIARNFGLDDPLDPRVVEAYWLGNQLLDNIDRSTFGKDLETRFRARAAHGWQYLVPAIPAGGLPHHSFHVFAVYPWVGLMRSGIVDEPLRVIDRCRIRSGRVVAMVEQEVMVRYRPLRWDSAGLHLGPDTIESVRFAEDGLRLVGQLQPGDAVALHWDWVCGRLSDEQESRLRFYSGRMLQLVNRLPVSGPAAILG
jgi:hypothetical protein